MDHVQERAEQVLADVPAWLWDGERLPVPVEQIADSCFGLLIRDVKDMQAAPGAPELAPGPTLSGLLLPALGEIWVNADEARQWPPRRRFTIGHELGHLVMHATGQQALFCRSTSVDETVETASPRVRGHMASRVPTSAGSWGAAGRTQPADPWPPVIIQLDHLPLGDLGKRAHGRLSADSRLGAWGLVAQGLGGGGSDAEDRRSDSRSCWERRPTPSCSHAAFSPRSSAPASSARSAARPRTS